MRVKILKDTFHYKKGEIVEVSKNEAFGLIDSGSGILTKEMTVNDYQTDNIKKIITTKRRDGRLT